MKKRSRDVILFMGTYPPRECGIATFTRDLTTAVNKTIAPRLETKILAINKNGSNIYNYPKNVIYQISDNDVDDYIQTAKLINRDNKIKLVCIQHEFGIFGGEYGDHLLAFLEILEKPVVLTFHSVLPSPNDRLRKAVIALAERVQTIIVMTKTGVDILRRDYELTTSIKIIPHGIPTVKFETQKREKRQLGFKDKIILSSFGLMSCGKGYEVVIESLPEIVKRFPKLLYLIVGETHPVVRKHEGEEYRNFLEEKVKELGLQKNVKFYNKYLTLDEIIQYLKASDVYISSSKDPNQITSGTLSYAMGCGRAVVSTPFIHAKDAVKKDKGILAEFDDPESFSKAIISILSSRKTRRSMEEHAYHHSRSMTWPNVALSYDRVFRENLKIPVTHDLPEINTAHLEKLTDDFGVIQFAKQSDPDLESGYTLDDNARALLTCAMHYKHSKQFKTLNLIKTYLDYIKFIQRKDGKLYNQVDKDKRIDYENWSDDAHGRAIWALGLTYATESIPEDLKAEAEKILVKAAPIALKITSPRAVAFSLLGLCAYNKEKKNPVRRDVR